MKLLLLQLMKKPVRVVEFMKDFDRFNNNTISKENFIRAMDICGFQLEEPEKEIIYNQLVKLRETFLVKTLSKVVVRT